MLSWFKTRLGRILALAGALFGIIATALITGGAVASAAIIMISTYVGVMITLDRFRSEAPDDASLLYRLVTWPIHIFANFAFKYRLFLTIGLGALAAYIVGIQTVTGVAVAALSAITGDILVSLYADVSNAIRELLREDQPLITATA